MPANQDILHQTADLNIADTESEEIYVEVGKTCGAFSFVIVGDATSDPNSELPVVAKRAFNVGLEDPVTAKEVIQTQHKTEPDEDAIKSREVQVTDGEDLGAVKTSFVDGDGGNVVYSVNLAGKVCDYVKLELGAAVGDFVGKLRVSRV